MRDEASACLSPGGRDCAAVNVLLVAPAVGSKSEDPHEVTGAAVHMLEALRTQTQVGRPSFLLIAEADVICTDR